LMVVTESRFGRFWVGTMVGMGMHGPRPGEGTDLVR
jgi:hypothetical protein